MSTVLPTESIPKSVHAAVYVDQPTLELCYAPDIYQRVDVFVQACKYLMKQDSKYEDLIKQARVHLEKRVHDAPRAELKAKGVRIDGKDYRGSDTAIKYLLGRLETMTEVEYRGYKRVFACEGYEIAGLVGVDVNQIDGAI